MFLLSRNWCQVKNSDAIYAIAEGFNGNTVKGGTGWAVQWQLILIRMYLYLTNQGAVGLPMTLNFQDGNIVKPRFYD